MDDLAIQHNMSTAYHPQTDGTTEKMNDAIESAVCYYVNDEGDDRDNYLSGVEFALNNLVSVSLGLPPVFLNYGFHPRVPANTVSVRIFSNFIYFIFWIL